MFQVIKKLRRRKESPTETVSSRKRLPSVSIVIPAYNETLYIERCLESIREQTKPVHEVIVVDNLSTDDTARIVRKYREKHKDDIKIRLLSQHQSQGLIPTRNYGMIRAEGDVIGRIDADSTLEPHWVGAVQQAFLDKKLAGATGPVIYNDMPSKSLGKWGDNNIRTAIDKLAQNKDYRFLFGSNMAVRRTVWHAMKDDFCLDKEDKMHEDIDIALHLYQAGYKTAYVRDMLGGMSARRVEDSPKDFYKYLMRYENTYKTHGITSTSARLPIAIYLAIYFPAKFIRLFYDGGAQKFTLEKLRTMRDD